ncbi:hypothetical protein FQA39_LY08390 [Lamprigera yunnana]|nr:hypothetical protein FQA39_LY08390 [Lamprigera yunnana]
MNKRQILKVLNRTLYLSKMAKSKFEYVKSYESEDFLLPNCWIVVRVDGKGFHKFSEKHNFEKPNDLKALNLMNRAAMQVMLQYKDIALSYGESDEYSFVFRKETELHNRRATKILTYVNSLFSSSYVFYWNNYFHNQKLLYPPSFDARIVLYPSNENLQDYLAWRQVDTHINNLYNTTFWALIQKGNLTNKEAEQRLSGSSSSDKNEILFSEFGINYNNEPLMYKKGTILLRKKINNPRNDRLQQVIFPLHEDMVQNRFWGIHSEILTNEGCQFYQFESELPELVQLQLKICKTNEKEKCEEIKEVL